MRYRSRRNLIYDKMLAFVMIYNLNCYLLNGSIGRYEMNWVSIVNYRSQFYRMLFGIIIKIIKAFQIFKRFSMNKYVAIKRRI